MALVLGATALSALSMSPAMAQFVSRNGSNGDGGDYFFFMTDGENGQNASTNQAANTVTNTTNFPAGPGSPPVPGTPWGGSANGGRGGNGVTFLSLNPFNLGLEAGDGGRGGHGGHLNLTNNAYLATSGSVPGATGFIVQANGGNGGNGGTAIGATAASSVIVTSGDNINGITVQADGGRGGNGGLTGTLGFGDGGDGGRGGHGGTATGSNAGEITTTGRFSRGMLVRSAGGAGGDGAQTIGLLVGSGGNGGLPTTGGTATGVNSGRITTTGDYAGGMVVQSVGGGGGDGGGQFGAFGGGGAGAPGNHGGTATATNTGSITTRGAGAIGLLVESVGGGGGDGGGAAGIVSIGGNGGGGGDGGVTTGNLGGTITTGADGSGDGAHGVLIQSVGGGGGNGGYAFSVDPVAAVAIGGSGGTAGEGKEVKVDQAGSGLTVSTAGRSAIGILAQSVGGGGGNGGGSFALGGIVSVAVGGKGGAGGAGGAITYDVGNADVTTNGADSAGIVVQSVGGGGGNGGFAVSASTVVAVGIGGEGKAGGSAKKVDVTTGGSVDTLQDRSSGIVAQSIGGGGGNGGFSVSGSAAASIGVGGKGEAGGAGGIVELDNSARVTTAGVQSHGLLAQSVGGGGGSGGFSVAVGGPSFAVGGSGSAGGNSEKVTLHNSGEISTRNDLSVGILAQSVGGGGGDGGLAGAGGLFTAVGVGGKGGAGGDGGEVEVVNSARIGARGDLSHGILAQSVGGGGGNGGSAGAVSVGAFVGIGVSVGGEGGPGRDAKSVQVTHNGEITVDGQGAKGIIAQAIGGGGGNGGQAFSGAFSAGLYGSAAVAVSVGGGGGNGGAGGVVTLRANGNISALSDAAESGGILAQSIGGGGGNGGRATSIAGAVSNGVAVNLGVGVGGGGGSGGIGRTVRVETGLNGGGAIVTRGFQSAGILAQSIGGGGGNAGDSFGGAGGYGNNVTVSATVNIGGAGGNGNYAGDVYVTNAMAVTTEGDSSSAIVAQSIGGGGGNGGTSTGGTANVGGGSGVNIGANFAMGGSGGNGSYGNTVDVLNSGILATSGDFSYGIIAQSIGGGGGIGGSSTAKSYNIGGSSQTSVNVNMGLGGSGGGASEARKVTVDNRGAITTQGFGATGIVAMAVGGGGGAAGAASASDEDVDIGGGGGDNGQTTVSIGVALGLAGGTAGDGGEVEVANNSRITTHGAFAYGISANSIGGGGGIGGSSSAGASAEYAIGGGIGGAGGSAGSGKRVDVRNLAGGAIHTHAENSIGIFAQSVGGGGGAGGAGESTGSDGGVVDVKLSMGGTGAGGGDGGIVNVENRGSIQTDEANSHGIMAQSLGGSGGIGGASGSSTADAQVSIGFALGGAGGDGGIGRAVGVTNHQSGVISTLGDNSYGIFAQSIGGGGGAAGAGSTRSGSEEEEGEEAEDSNTVNVNLAIGGIGGAGNGGGDVTVDNDGIITTRGALSHGVFAQSVGGGGGAAGSASNTSSADLSIGFAIGIAGGAGANAGDVEVNNNGLIETSGDGAIGIMAQAVGGAGGYAGVVSDDAAGDNGFALNIGGQGGNGGDGGEVKVTVEGDIVTHGERAHGVVAQSVGGGGGYGGDAKGKTSTALAIGGFGGAGGDGKDVTVIRTGTITTTGKDSVAIIAQSVGGGGGFGGAGFGRFGASEDGESGLGDDTIGFTSPGGDKGTGGVVTIVQTGEIDTTGDRAHGIVAQAVGGGGGIGGTSSLASGQSGAGSQGGIGDANATSATANSEVTVRGDSAYALFGQSATGQGSAGAVTLTAQSNLFAQGADSVAAYAESTSNAGFAKGDITVSLNGEYTIGGGESGAAVMLVGGADNRVDSHGLLYAMGHEYQYDYVGAAPTGPVPLNAVLESLLDDFSPVAISGTSGNDRIFNSRTATTLGRVIGNVDLGKGLNAFENGLDSSVVALQSIDLGGGLFTNQGLYTNQGIGVVAAVDVTGGFTQTADGTFVTDLDLDTQTNDRVDLTGAGDFAGEAPLNFLSIDRLFGEYVLAEGAAMAESGAGLVPTTLHPTVGYDFQTRVDNGTDLVLYADKPSFEDLIKDPASGVDDGGAVQMAQYLDGLENVMSPADPPSELARMFNMVRMLPDMETYGKTIMRLTPHYAVHSYELASRATDLALQAGRDCARNPLSYADDGNCVWLGFSPESNYDRDAGARASLRDDMLKQISAGGLGSVNDKWSLGGSFAYTEVESEIRFRNELLSRTTGENWQIHALANYSSGPYFADFALGGGGGRFSGKRDTTVAQVGYIPGETLAGAYLPEMLLPGIGNSVSYEQDVTQFNMSARFGYAFEKDNVYLKPNIQLDGRWIEVTGEEKGSVAAFRFDGPGNFYYSATPGIEAGADIALGEQASLRAYAKGGVELSNFSWEARGQLIAAEGLGAAPLKLTQRVDSPLYRVGLGLELNTVHGLALGVQYNGAFGDRIEQQTVSGSLKYRF